tara:strand:- start:1323 stop:2144 length:822 start_codon:yes stop_codon:yes gene_type:complete
MIYRKCKKSDFEPLVELFSKAYSRKISKKEIEWLYIGNPISSGLYNFVATNEKNMVIGHTGFIKQEFILNGKTYIGGLTVGTASDNRHVGLFPPLYSALEDEFACEFDFFYGYPNENSYPFFKKLFKYEDVPSVACFSSKNNQQNIVELSELVFKNKNEKSQEYLEWRLSKNPINHYFIKEFKDFKIIFKYYKEQSIDLIGFVRKGSNIPLEIKNIDMNSFKCNFLLAGSLIKNFELHFAENLDKKNRFIIKKLNNDVPYENLLFQMYDIDIF